MSIKEFQDRGYSLLNNVIDQDIRDIVTQYTLFDEIQDFKTDGNQVPNAHAKYADPLMETMLIKLLPLMEENTGLKLYPTYSFYRVYRTGDILYPHTDRESCEISTSICFNYSYDDSQYSWPIIISGNSISMKPGDMMIYRGIDLEHERKQFLPPKDNDWHVQAFLHYVDANGEYSDYMYDKRESLGIINKANKKYIIRTDGGY